MSSRVLVAVLGGVLLLSGSASGDPGADKASIDGRIARLRASAVHADATAAVLTGELSAFGARVRELQQGVSTQQARLNELEGQLESAQARLTSLDGVIRTQTVRLARLHREHVAAVGRLEQRVREIYVSDDPDILSFVVGTSSFSDLIDNLELLSRIGRQDQRIVQQVADARDAVADARARSRAARAEAAAVARQAAASASEQRSVVVRLAASRDRLASVQADKQVALSSIRENRDEVVAEIDALEQQSAALAEQIRQAQEQASAAPGAAAGASTVGNGSLSWPVNGPVTSGFGERWGRMHEGVDIAVGSGTPVHASAAGTVIYAGWLGGYGNIVVVDHGNGLSTAYGHNSSVAVALGDAVVAGQVIAYSGSTGHSTGPHVHFEVRVGGSPVDPLAYL